MTTNTCTRTDGFEAYTVRAGHEWATILVRGWQGTGPDQQPREIGEILIYSSYGAWAHQWGHIGQPFKQWLLDVECDYVAGKFLGSKAYQFDGEKTVEHLCQSIIEHRRSGDLTKNDARTIWDWVEENEIELSSSESEFVRCMGDCSRQADWKHTPPGDPWAEPGPERGARYFLEEPWDRLATSLNRDFANFWGRVWPTFIAHLKAEAQPVTSKAASGEPA